MEERWEMEASHKRSFSAAMRSLMAIASSCAC